MDSGKQCCCACRGQKPSGTAPWVTGYRETAAGEIPVVADTLTEQDRLGALKVRCAIGRNNYRVEPGLYALGNPDEQSPVLVTANYKLTFDTLRNDMKGRSAWILVLDTKGINVWCAAGKGTFGTDELIRQVRDTGLKAVVTHRDLVVPQLGAPGVAAHTVKQKTGFKVNYGPVRSCDIPRYLDDGMQATRPMRQVTFTLMERLILTPVELAGSLKLTLGVLAAVFLLGGLSLRGFSMQKAQTMGAEAFLIYLAGLLCGAVLVPALLPWIPGRAFSLKGCIAGIAATAAAAACMGRGLFDVPALLLMMSAISSFFAMNFTGSTPFTSLSGVRKEMALAVPLQIISLVTGLVLWKLAG